ncbi:ParB N-terminal domain-containing protein [Streptomyces sp. ZAF1911]|uniref:ParB/RepB/Spo0J family partition protein n=1 Tax=Streptomyces sp. ZAF1911 TaxID=2944129 RepID=UPI00237BA56E|nr:ParB N-terminal domain-containing protein [Streptomyces sp. ZAF1911]MDD9379705.1 ParB N-terminal domain-containing protein [Streptomyces sp. ZAF1911]
MFDEPDVEIRMVPVASLLPSDSPRLGGLCHDHAQALAESGRELEPILVDRATGRVVDGMHRLRAAIIRGARDLPVRYVEGSSADLFIRSVEANTRHGLPLTRKDRRAAVIRILDSHPHWSDRVIAAVSGVSPKTVAAARRGVSGEESPHSKGGDDASGVSRVTARVGRVRPVDMAQRREKVRRLLAEHPRATLRYVAEEAGVSISTVHRMRHAASDQPTGSGRGGEVLPASFGPMPGEDAEPRWSGSRKILAEWAEPQAGTEGARPRAAASLYRDPSIRSTDRGRALLRWLYGRNGELAVGQGLLASVPPHCMQAAAEVARHYAREWERLANTLQRREGLNNKLREAQ